MHKYMFQALNLGSFLKSTGKFNPCIVSTECGNVVYLHILSDKVHEIETPFNGKVKRVIAYTDKQKIEFRQHKGKLYIPEINIVPGTTDYIIEIHKK